METISPSLAEYIKSLYNLPADTDGFTPQQVSYALSVLSPINYALSYHTVKGHPITFTIPDYNYSKASGHRPWQMEMLRAITDINNKEVNIIKSRQLGLSELAVMGLLYLADVYSYDALKLLYAFPTISSVRDFKKSRIDPQLANGYYSTLVDKDNNSLNQMSIRDSRIFFRTASKASSLEGVDLNAIWYDEYERVAGSAAEGSGEESLKSDNKYALIRRWSTPSVGDFGIDKKYKQSDQHVWLIKCEHCGFWQEMDFKKNLKIIDESLIDRMANVVRPNATMYVCQKCGKSLESSRWYNGTWVSRFPDSGRSVGYYISQLDAVWLSSDQIYANSLKANSKQLFYNYTLGMPYQDTSLAFLDGDVENNTREYLKNDLDNRGDYAKISVGIDWGSNYHHLVVLGLKSNGLWDIIHLERVKTSTGVEHIEEDLKQIIQILYRYEPDIILPDLGYSGNYVQKLIQVFGDDKVFGVLQRTAKTNNDMNAHFNEAGNTVLIDKLMQNMIFISEMKSGRIGFPRDTHTPMMNLYKTHWKNVIIRDEEQDDGTTIKTITRKDGDHFAQSSVYAYVGMVKIVKDLSDSQNNVQISSLGVDNNNSNSHILDDSSRTEINNNILG